MAGTGIRPIKGGGKPPISGGNKPPKSGGSGDDGSGMICLGVIVVIVAIALFFFNPLLAIIIFIIIGYWLLKWKFEEFINVYEMYSKFKNGILIFFINN